MLSSFRSQIKARSKPKASSNFSQKRQPGLHWAAERQANDGFGSIQEERESPGFALVLKYSHAALQCLNGVSVSQFLSIPTPVFTHLTHCLTSKDPERPVVISMGLGFPLAEPDAICFPHNKRKPTAHSPVVRPSAQCASQRRKSEFPVA